MDICIRRTLTLSIVLLLGAFFCMGFAQELKVKSFVQVPEDLIARTSPREDLNGKPCAVIRVGIGLRDVKFAGNVMGDPIYEPGEYMVYMPQGNTELTVRHADYIPLVVRFSDYGIHRLQSGCTYRLTILREGYTPSPLAESSQSGAPVSSSGSDSGVHVSEVSDGKQILPFDVNGVKFNMIRVEGGTFQMGATDEKGIPFSEEKPVHSVALSTYYIGEMEVTQALWQAVMGSNPSFNKGSSHPVENVSWKDCQDFIAKLNQLTGMSFSLPTEAQWEYAARGGNKSRHTQYSGSNNIDDVAWYEGNSNGNTHPVGEKCSNELGIYDMSGNVFEWCNDWCGDFDIRVYRGGSWLNKPWNCRCSYSFLSKPSFRSSTLGFRLALLQ